MPRTNWNGVWQGGRTSVDADGKTVYWIEKSIGPRGANRRYFHCLGPITEPAALGQLELFKADPVNYRPPSRVQKDAVLASERLVRDHKEGAIILDTDLVGKFIAALESGYGNRQAATPHHVLVVESYLTKWAASKVLFNRDLRDVKLTEIRAHVEGLAAGKKHWIVALRSLTAWLRWTGRLNPNQDPTTALSVPQAKRASPAAKASKVYSPEILEQNYAALPSQVMRDIFRARICTGLHVTEIRRIAEGQGVIQVVDAGEIAAIVDVLHKGRQTHRLSVDAATLAALRRLQERFRSGATTIRGKRKYKGWPSEKTFARALATAAEATGHPVVIAHLRHTFATLATQCGRLIYPPGTTVGVPEHIVGQALGHAGGSPTTRAHYIGQAIPPMIVLPVRLIHSDDPLVLASAARDAAAGEPRRARRASSKPAPAGAAPSVAPRSSASPATRRKQS